MIHFARKILLTLAIFYPVQTFAAGVKDEASVMANFLRASRSVITKRKNVIEDAKQIPEPAKFIEISKAAYKNQNDSDLIETTNVKSLIKAVEAVVLKAQKGDFDKTWEKSDYQNKFLPARYTHEVLVELAKLTSNKVVMKLTAPDRLLINPENQPDEWEMNQMKVFEEKQKNPEWKRTGRNEVISEQVGEDCRYILPEFYEPSCMGCHAGPEGKRIHKGKVEGVAGDLGGAISITYKAQKGC